jgi:hypothetical protein
VLPRVRLQQRELLLLAHVEHIPARMHRASTKAHSGRCVRSHAHGQPQADAALAAC